MIASLKILDPSCGMPMQGGRTALAVRTVARDTVVEAVRGRWLWMSAVAALAIGVIAAFAQALALSAQHDVAIAFAAPLARVAAVLIVALGAIASVSREQSERTLLLALAAPMSRSAWLAGKALGFLAIAALTALILALPVALCLPAPMPALAWTASLFLELALVASVSLAIGIVLVQVPPAVCAVAAFYVLARDLHVVLLLAQRAENYSELGSAGPVVQFIAAIVPRLDLFTRTDWLLGAVPTLSAYAMVGAQALVYFLLAGSVAVLDLRRTPLG